MLVTFGLVLNDRQKEQLNQSLLELSLIHILAGLEITLINDVTPIPHNGCRPPKRPRG